MLLRSGLLLLVALLATVVAWSEYNPLRATSVGDLRAAYDDWQSAKERLQSASNSRDVTAAELAALDALVEAAESGGLLSIHSL